MKNEVDKAKLKIELLVNDLLDTIDTDLLSDSQKIAYLKALQPYVLPKLENVKIESDMNISDNLKWIVDAEDVQIEEKLQKHLLLENLRRNK